MNKTTTLLQKFRDQVPRWTAQTVGVLVFFTTALFGFMPKTANATPTALIDNLIVGDDQSEQLHKLTSEKSEIVRGALDQPARKLLPGGGKPWEGGRLSFTMAIDPKVTNYLTARFWGDEVNQNYLLLFCEGKQVGYRHLGDIDVLALPDDEPRYNGRFYYVTTPLPRAMTNGKSELHLEIRSNGPIWGYGRTFDEYQKPMTAPSRGIYRLYVHTDGCFVPPADEKQGETPPAPKRSAPGPETLDQVEKRVNGAIEGLLKSKRPLNQMQVQFLARAYFVKWTAAHNEKKVIAQVIAGVDERYQAWKKDPLSVWSDKATWNPDWFGVGPAADAVRLLANPVESSLDLKIDGDKTRRAAWSALFQASRDWLRTHRRYFTNQTMFVDSNLYLSHLAVAAIDPKNAWADEKAKRYLYESVGLQPWLGSDTPNGSEKNLGEAYYQITDKGLSKELGYVGGYGEILGQMTDIYDATRTPGRDGDPKIKAQLAKVQRARAFFRYPMLDEEGHPAIRLETGVGWRDTHFPGVVTYAQRPGGDGSALQAAAASLEPVAVGAVQQMFADNQFFGTVAKHLEDNRFRATVGLLGIPDEYQTIKAQPLSPHRLPMSWDQPNVVFADEENGVVAIKNGEEILYVSLYWRANYGVNSLARTHYLTPRYQQTAVVYEDVQFEDSRQTYKRPDWINFGFGNGGLKYPGDLHSAHAGEAMPIAKIPADVSFKPGQVNPYAGRCDFYQLRYGPYLIGMNATKEKTFELKVATRAMGAADLVSGKTISLEAAVKVGPRSTVVLYFGQ